MLIIQKYAGQILLAGMIGFAILLVNPPILDTVKQQFVNDVQPTPTIKIETPTSYPTAHIPEEIFVPTTNTDPFITCNIHADCGGGSKQLRRSVCNNSTCCQIGGKWVFYESTTKCKADQEAEKNKANAGLVDCYVNGMKYRLTPRDCASATAPGNYNYTFPTYAPLPTWKPLPTFEPYPEYDGVESAPRISKDQCISAVNDKYRSQMTSLGCSYPCPDSGDCGSTSTCEGIWYYAKQEMASCNQYQ